jgi:hypothetical protein
MKKIAFIILALCLFVSCSKESEDPIKTNTYSIVGRWEQISYLSSDGLFIAQKDGSYYDFKLDNSFIKYTGTILNETITGSYAFDTQKKSIHCELGGGWHEAIEVIFSDSQNAEFRIKTNTGSSTIKVSRNNGSKNN